MDWKQITLYQWKQLEEISNKEYEDDILKSADIISIVFGIDDPMELTPTKFNAFVSELNFLTDSIPETKLCNTYTINGTKYNFDGNCFSMTMSQLMDWRAFSTAEHIDYGNCLSVFLVPEGHKYNDGYDIDKTIDDINTLPITDVMKIYSFWSAGFSLFTSTLTDYFNRQMKNLKLSPAQRAEMRNNLKQLNELLSTYSPTL